MCFGFDLFVGVVCLLVLLVRLPDLDLWFVLPILGFFALVALTFC